LNYHRKLRLLLIGGFIFHALLASVLELGNDEVYYQTYALHLQWNYFDHPPLVGFLIRLSTFNLHFHQEFFVRLGPVFCSAAGTYLIFITGSRLKNQRTGWYAALLYNLSFYTSIIAGTFILPDSPEVVCWMAAIYGMVLLLDKQRRDVDPPLTGILLGLAMGLCVFSKIHGLFLCFGFAVYALFNKRSLFKSRAFWIAMLLVVAFIIPLYWWNAQNNFITYRYHEGRIGFFGHRADPDQLLQQLLGSAFYCNPVNFILYTLTLIAILKKKFTCPYLSLLLWLSLPLIIILLFTSLFNETLPHWSGPSYLSLMLLTAAWMDQRQSRIFTLSWIRAAALFFAFVTITGVLGILYLPFHLGKKDPGELGRGDITLDMSGWKKFASQFDSLYRSDQQDGRMNKQAIILSDYWFPAAHLDYYYARPNNINLIAAGKLRNIHHFAWLNERRPRIEPGSDAYFIYPTNYYGPPAPSLRMLFERVEDSVLLPQYLNGIEVRKFVIYRMHRFKGDSSDYLIPGIR